MSEFANKHYSKRGESLADEKNNLCLINDYLKKHLDNNLLSFSFHTVSVREVEDHDKSNCLKHLVLNLFQLNCSRKHLKYLFLK